MSFVMDACAIIAYLRGEQGADIVESILEGDDPTAIHAINLCEVYYNCLQRNDEDTARELVTDLESIGLVIHEDMDPVMWQTAGQYKANMGGPLPDCFAIALTRRLEAVLLTSDHKHFDYIAAEGACRIRFIR